MVTPGTISRITVGSSGEVVLNDIFSSVTDIFLSIDRYLEDRKVDWMFRCFCCVARGRGMRYS